MHSLLQAYCNIQCIETNAKFLDGLNLSKAEHQLIFSKLKIL